MYYKERYLYCKKRYLYYKERYLYCKKRYLYYKERYLYCKKWYLYYQCLSYKTRKSTRAVNHQNSPYKTHSHMEVRISVKAFDAVLSKHGQ